MGSFPWPSTIPVTDVPTTIDQCIESGVPTYLSRQAIERAGRGGQLGLEQQSELVLTLEERDGR